MKLEGEEVHIETEEASGGDKNRSMRTALIVGVLAAIGLLSVVWITGSLRFNQANPVRAEASASPEP